MIEQKKQIQTLNNETLVSPERLQAGLILLRNSEDPKWDEYCQTMQQIVKTDFTTLNHQKLDFKDEMYWPLTMQWVRQGELKAQLESLSEEYKKCKYDCIVEQLPYTQKLITEAYSLQNRLPL